MDSQKKRPQIYWSQNENEITVKVDILLDDMVRSVNKGIFFPFEIFNLYMFVFSIFVETGHQNR